MPNGSSGGIFETTMTGTGASATLQSTNVAANGATTSRYLDTDGVGTIWYPDSSTGTLLYQYIPSSNTTNAYYPCYNAGTTTGTNNTLADLRDRFSTRQSLAMTRPDRSGWAATATRAAGAWCRFSAWPRPPFRSRPWASPA